MLGDPEELMIGDTGAAPLFGEASCAVTFGEWGSRLLSGAAMS